MSDEIGMWVSIDSRRVLERFSTDDLLREAAARKGVAIPEKRQERDDILLDMIEEAIGYLRTGRADDALLTLERAAYPKFSTFEQAVSLYVKQVRK